ncbi:MAG: hypothetical protein V4640_06645 [Verrucomicrobiota bacterium]
MKPYALLLASIPVLCISSCEKTRENLATTGDVTFARNTFEALTRGESDVATKIDWPVFTSLGNNLGATYLALPTEVDKQKFITAFITQFATSFRESGGTVENFTNWRVVFHDKQKTEVAADSPKGTLTVIVAERDDQERVSSITMSP